MKILLSVSRLIDALNERIGRLVYWLVLVMVLVSASGFSMMGPRVIVTAEARPETTSAAASTRRVFALIKQSPSRGRSRTWTDVRRWGARPYTGDPRGGKAKGARGRMTA